MAMGRPGVLVAKVVADFALLVSRALLALIFVVLFAVSILGSNTVGLGSTVLWAGWLTAATGLLLLVEASAWAIIWGQAKSLRLGETAEYLESFGAHFINALKYRAFTYFAGVFIVSTVVSVVWGAIQVSRIFSPSNWVVAALVLATLLTALALFIGWVRFSVELANVQAITSGESWLEAFAKSIQFVARHPINVYRVFLQALGALIAPLLFYYVSIFMQNLALKVAVIAPVALGVRILAEVFMALGFAAFSILTSYGLIALFNAESPQKPSENGLLSVFKLFKQPQLPNVGFSDLLPKKNPHVFDLDEVFSMVPPSGEEFEDVEAPSPQDFDLDGVLNGSESRASDDPENIS